MTAQQRIVRVRRNYNQWVANETLEDYALRFTAKKARRWSSARVANTAIGAISFLALEAIGGSITINYGFANASAAILVVSAVIFLTSLPIAYYACRDGVDIDLLTRGAGFGYIGSTITSLIYASFTFLFFAIEAAIMSLALELCFGVPLTIGYVISSLVVIPLVTHGITLISRFQLWTQPAWIVLHLVPFAFIAALDMPSFRAWTAYGGEDASTNTFNLLLFGTASTVVFSLVAQIGEQVDFLRFLPARDQRSRLSWWVAYLAAGPGWIVPGLLKMLAGSFLAFLAIRHLVPTDRAAEPTQMYLVAFQYVFSSPNIALAFAGAFIILSQLKINVTNAYAGSIAWSNFFSRLTHSHPGRVVWVIFNVAIALMLMELGIFKMLEHTLGLYSIVAVAWVGALVADLVINKPLGLSPPMIEFKRAHLYDINPVGVGAMLLAGVVGIAAFWGAFGPTLQALASFLALAVAFLTAPAIAYLTKGRFYIARAPRQNWGDLVTVRCAICEHPFETEDMAHCPAYSGPICSLCCSLETRCRDCCKPQARIANQAYDIVGRSLPDWVFKALNTDVGHYLGVLSLFAGVIGLVLAFVYFQVSDNAHVNRHVLQSTLWTVFFILTIIGGVAAWLFVLAHESRRVAEEETRRQTDLLMREIEAHKRTDAKLQKAKEVAEAASNAKSRHVAGLSHELRTPLNAILGYAQILERDTAIPTHRVDAIRVVRRNAEHLSGLIDGLLDISKIEAGRFQLNRNEVRIREFLDQLVDMFRLQAHAKGLDFHYATPPHLPATVQTDESRLRQVLINLLSNAIKFTDSGEVSLQVSYRSQVAEFVIADSGIGIHAEDFERIFQPFERARSARARAATGTGLGLTITKMLTETMGGEIRLHSAPGKGSTFRIKLFLPEVVNPRALPTIDDRVRGYTGPRRTILIADDDPMHRDLLAELLIPLGFEVIAAGTGLECLTLTERHAPSLVLLDVGMPDLDGWEVARRLRRTASERLAIVMLSALAPDKTRELEHERLHDGYLMKPVHLRQLLEQIHILLDIEWTYEKASELTPPLPLKSLIALDLPAAQDLDELIRLGEIGHIRGIEAKLDALAETAPQCGPLIGQLRTLVMSFDLRGFNAAVSVVRRHHV
jgi:signal transduction histidine kinase/ActR/RegA family two-component response regulator